MNAPSAEPAAPTLAAAVPERLLNEGEVVILAIKPSIWFVVLVSWQVLAVAVVAPLLVYVATETIGMHVPLAQATVNTVCLAAALARMCLASVQWMGRLYVLTNLRVLRIRGLFWIDTWSCLLTQVREVRLSFMRLEHLVGLGSLQFFTSQRHDAEAPATLENAWIHIPKAAKVQEVVQQTIHRLR